MEVDTRTNYYCDKKKENNNFVTLVIGIQGIQILIFWDYMKLVNNLS